MNGVPEKWNNIAGIVPAFECGSVTYYEFENVFNEPAMRGLSALDIYNDMEKKIDNAQLIQTFEAIRKLLRVKGATGGLEVDIFKVDELCSLSLDKLKWVVNIALVERLASVLYFDDTEDPREHDMEYGDKKIARWRLEPGLSEMFKKKSLKSFIPWYSISQIDLANYSEVQKKMSRSISEKIYSATRTESQKKDTSRM